MRLTRGDDGDLLRAAARGDDRAFADFYRRWLPTVTGYHLRRTRSRELAFDLTAETFAAIVADLQRFDPDRGSAAGWLFEIVEHKLIDSRRAKVESSARTRPEFASEMECSEAVVRQRVHRGLRRLRERLKDTP